MSPTSSKSESVDVLTTDNAGSCNAGMVSEAVGDVIVPSVALAKLVTDPMSKSLC